MMAGWTMGVDGWAWMLGWAVVLVVVVWLLVRDPRGREPGPPSGDSAVEILRARLARGEIGPEEFERTLSILAMRPGHAPGSGPQDHARTPR